MPRIRSASATDIAAITNIYAEHVLHGTGTFETIAPTSVEMEQRWTEVLSRNLPYLVIEQDAVILGFAYCNWFKPRPAYRFSAEDSIYLSASAQGKGLGRLLLVELIAQAERAGVRKLIAVIGDSANKGSIAVHRGSGFHHVGMISGCGWKFDRWLDVVLMERTVGLGNSTAPAPAHP